MTADKRFKRRVRARAQKTGESYAAARRHLFQQERQSMPNNTTHDNPIDRGLAECVVAFVLDRYGLVIGASAAERVASAKRAGSSAEGLSRALTVTGADPETGEARAVLVDHVAMSQFVDEKLHALALTEDARQVVTAARDEAVRLGHPYIGQEHLVVAIAATPGPGRDLFTAGGHSVEDILESLAPMLVATPKAGDVPCWTPRAVRALNLAQAEAAAAAASQLGSDHVVAGIVADSEGLGAWALLAAGLSLARVRSLLDKR